MIRRRALRASARNAHDASLAASRRYGVILSFRKHITRVLSLSPPFGNMPLLAPVAFAAVCAGRRDIFIMRESVCVRRRGKRQQPAQRHSAPHKDVDMRAYSARLARARERSIIKIDSSLFTACCMTLRAQNMAVTLGITKQ